METWNYRGYISTPLEAYGKNYIGDTCIRAHEIENGKFVHAMFSILLIKFGTLDDVRSFVEMCNDYADLSLKEIKPEKAQKIFNEFVRILKT